MHRQIFLLLCSCCLVAAHAQQTDTLTIFYPSDGYRLSATAKGQLDGFLKAGWDRLSIRSYTDETDGEEYNLQLSQRRAETVYRYFLNRNIAAANLVMQFFGEAEPLADNSTEEGRAINRQTTIVGYRYPRITLRQAQGDNSLKPVTTTLDNGFIITYRPGTVPEEWRYYLDAGVSPFTLVTNTQQMRQAALYTNTTNGEILSSVMVFCGQVSPCRLDSPVLVRVPIAFQSKCDLGTIKFFVSVARGGRLVWEEQSKPVYPEVINGRQYLRIWMDDFCQCINFDIKVPECYEVDSAQLMVKTRIKGLTTELVGLNSVYLPKQIDAATHNILFVKDELRKALVSFSAYYGKRYVRFFRNRPLTNFPFDEASKSFVVSLDSVRFYLPKLKDYDLSMRVNGDRYRTHLEKDRCQFVYVKRQDESITVDLWIPGKKGRMMEYKNQPLAEIPFDKVKGEYVIDRVYLKELEMKKGLTRR